MAGAFDRLNWQHSREFDQTFSNNECPGVSPGRGGGMMGSFGIASRTNDVMTQTRLRQTNWNGG